MKNYSNYRVEVPEGKSGEWSVEKFTVSPEDERFQRLRCAINPRLRGRFVPAGTYTALKRNGGIVMSDTPDEIDDHWEAVRMARNHILINGLGLGCVLDLCLRKPEVNQATVVEKSSDVVALVGDYYYKKFPGRVRIVCQDAFVFHPPRGVKYGMVWHDIWDNIYSDNLKEMHKLHRKYGRSADWQGSWCRDYCENIR